MRLMSGRPHKTPRSYHEVDENAFLQYRQLSQSEAVKELRESTRNGKFTMNMKSVLFGTVHPVPWIRDIQRLVPLMGCCTLSHNCSRGLNRELTQKKYAKFYILFHHVLFHHNTQTEILRFRMLLNVDKVDPGFSAEQGRQGVSRYVIFQ
jgi:hypothetical protein